MFTTKEIIEDNIRCAMYLDNKAGGTKGPARTNQLFHRTLKGTLREVVEPLARVDSAGGRLKPLLLYWCEYDRTNPAEAFKRAATLLYAIKAPGRVVNVFRRPLQVWQCYAPMVLSIPADWLAWCEREVFVVEHDIQTATVSLSHSQSFTGFTGEVTFRVHQGETNYLRVWQALGALAAFCGVGYKTTMGMGAVEVGEAAFQAAACAEKLLK